MRLYDRVYCGASCPESHEQYMKSLIKVGTPLIVNQYEKIRSQYKVQYIPFTVHSCYFEEIGTSLGQVANLEVGLHTHIYR